MSAADAQNLRQAALALHALSADDMQRVWRRLDDTQRQALSPMLDELDNLGIPKGRCWLDDGAEVSSGQAGSVWQGKVQDDVRILSRLAAHEALSLLTSQSLDTAVAVMQMAPWPWLAEVLEHWPAEHRHTMRARLAIKRAFPPKLLEHMLGFAASQATSQPSMAHHAAVAKPAGQRTWFRHIMSLFLFT